MLVSRQWLQKFFDAELPSAEALAEALTFHIFEIDDIKPIDSKGNPWTSQGLPLDTVLDVKVTPNRGSDCLSHRGIAKELSAILKIPLTHDPFGAVPALAPTTDAVAVTVEDTALCPRYIAGYVRGVKVGPSPAWLKAHLEAVGQRSINNVVDATNFVMFNVGQPLHAFDAGRLTQSSTQGGPVWHIVVRKARAGERILALDNKEYALEERMLVIADGNADVPIGVAGVKGGTPAGISEATTDIIIESANFDSVSVRKTARALKLRTDASSRFEQGIHPELAGVGMRACVDLILKVAGGELVGFADTYPTPPEPLAVSVSLSLINTVLGTELTGAEVADVFQRLGFAYKEEGGDFLVMVPHERLDLRIPEDLVEEVGRIVGYERVPAKPLSPMPGSVEVNKNFLLAERVREKLVGEGYIEVLTPVFVGRGERAVLNKVDSAEPYLRATLVDGLAEALKKNIPNKDLVGLEEVKIFEIGTVWRGGAESVVVGIVSETGGAKEHLLEEYAAANGLGDALTQYDAFALPPPARYKPFSRYPYIVRDIALWAPQGTDAEALRADIQKEAGELCVSVRLFDEFKKGDKTSYAFRLVFQSFERTLTEDEAQSAMARVAEALKARGFEIR